VDFRRPIALDVLAGVIGTAIVVLLVDKAKIGPYWLLLAILLILAAAQLPSLRLRIQVFRSGLAAFHMRFPVAEGPVFWRRSNTELVYWGVTGGTIANELRTMLVQEPGSRRNYRFLLMASDGKAIEEQVAFMTGATLPGANNHQQRRISQECAVAQTRLVATITLLKDSAPYKEGRLEVRLFDEFLPWWVYILDGTRMVVGILEFGQEVGEQPAAVLHKSPSHATLFDAFHGNFERAWKAARPA
jgi:hypothetical protein